MPTTLTLKNIPDAVYERLKVSAAAHRRSLNSEAIACLEKVLMANRHTVEERLARIRQLRASLRTPDFEHEGMDDMKREGRP